MNNQFNWIYYLNKYPDLKNNGVNTFNKALEHWTNHGKNEGRICNNLMDQQFNPQIITHPFTTDFESLNSSTSQDNKPSPEQYEPEQYNPPEQYIKPSSVQYKSEQYNPTEQYNNKPSLDQYKFEKIDKLDTPVKSIKPLNVTKLDFKKIKPVIYTETGLKGRRENNNHEPAIRKELEPTIRKELEPTIRKELEPTIRKELEPTIRKELEPTIRKALEPTIRKELEPTIRKELESIIKKELEISSCDIEDEIRQEFGIGKKNANTSELKSGIGQEIKLKLICDIEPIIKQQLKQELEPILKKKIKRDFRRELEPIVRQEFMDKFINDAQEPNLYLTKDSDHNHICTKRTSNDRDIVKIFINFEPDDKQAYGGGNISTHYIQKMFSDQFSGFSVTYDLNPDGIYPDIYLIIDPYPGRKYKKYGLLDVIKHRNDYNPNGKIVIRINDCDKTRPNADPNKLRETIIKNNSTNIDYFIYNSKFIRSIYEINKSNIISVPNSVVYNGCDSEMFQPNQIQNSNKKIRIVTHHWSSNMFKGYQTYYDLWKFCKNTDKFEFVFIGNNVPEMFSEVPISGPFAHSDLSDQLNTFDIYITDSKFDSCPNHVIEGIMCGLPVLYTNSDGGGRELCAIPPEPIGESFSTFKELICSLYKVVNNYDMYHKNVLKYKHLFDISRMCLKYKDVFSNLVYNNIVLIKEVQNTSPDGINFSFTITGDALVQIYNGEQIEHEFPIVKGEHKIIMTDKNNDQENQNKNSFTIIIKCRENGEVEYPSVYNFNTYSTLNDHKFKNNSDKELTILYCSDNDYFVGMFAGLTSVIKHVSHKNLEKMHFTFIVPIQDSERFTNLFKEFSRKMSHCDFTISVTYLKKTAISPIVEQTKCTNGGNHLLNLSNFSRMMIGEFFEYSNLLYLDADSVIQYDIFNKVHNLDLTQGCMYACCRDATDESKIRLLMKQIVTVNYDWSSLIGYSIDGESPVYMGAPFYTDCCTWNATYSTLLKIIKEHTNSSTSLYSLFTMSLMNIVFYGRIRPINGSSTKNKIGVKTLADLGSKRKNYTSKQLNLVDILDWSGIFKPWFKNGLNRDRWLKYDILNLSTDFKEVDDVKKGNVENFNDKSKSKSKSKSNTLSISHVHDLNLILHDKFIPDFSFEQNTFIHKTISTGDIFYYMSLFIDDDNYRKDFLREVFKTQLNENAQNMINMIYMTDLTTYVTKMSRVRFLAIDELSQKSMRIFYFGKGWPMYDNNKSVQENINNIGMGEIPIDMCMWYKPIGNEKIFDINIPMKIPTCMRYNEMWDENHTLNEIEQTKSDLVICHHKNDWEKYVEKYLPENKCNSTLTHNPKLVYIPHHADPNIFNNTGIERPIDILISGSLGIKHYPLRHRLASILKKYKNGPILKKYKIETHHHPGYNNANSFTNNTLIQYAAKINQSKICIACTSKWKYQLGKYIEIPMCGGVICGDIPFESDGYSDFILEVNLDMDDTTILNKIDNLLSNPSKLEMMSCAGELWANKFTTDVYCDRLIDNMNEYIHHYNIIESVPEPIPEPIIESVPEPIIESVPEPIIESVPEIKKIFIISDEIRKNHPEFNGQKWICDTLKEEFSTYYNNIVTTDPKSADIIWYIAPWNYRHVPLPFRKQDEWRAFLKTKEIVCTIHHIDMDKFKKGEHKDMFNFMNIYATKYHVLCDSAYESVKNIISNRPISKHSLWVNTDIFYHIPNKKKIRKKYDLDPNAFYVGSFQKDTEGKTTNTPKLSKGPDIFVNIVADMRKRNSRVEVILTGLRREYIITELEKKKIPYKYFNMVSLPEINELYNCLDLYLVSSRVEGGPRAIVEGGFCETPIISTDVGIATEFLPERSIYDMNSWKSYKNAVPDVIQVRKNVEKIEMGKQMANILAFLNE